MRLNRTGMFDRDYNLCWSKESTFVVGGETLEGVCCAYCGEYATVREHLTPLSFMQARASKGSQNSNFWTWILPSCEECNYIASDQVFQTPEEKRAYVQSRLSARYSEDLESDQWPDEELDDLGPRLGQYVMACQARSYITQLRVSYSGPLPPSMGSHEIEGEIRQHYRQMATTEAA